MRGILLAALLVAAAPTVFEPIQVPDGGRLQDPTTTPDGRTMFLTVSDPNTETIVALQSDAAGAWVRSVDVPFSGKWRDLEEVLTPDNSAMVFASNRPLPGTTQALDGNYNGKVRPGYGGNIWIVQRTASGWGTPQPLPSGVNSNTSVFSPAIAADGTLYFMRATGPQGLFHIFVSSPPYTTSTLAPFASDTAAEFDPTVSPDGNTVVFSSTRAPLPEHTSHLFVAYRNGSSWTTPQDLGPTVNGFGQSNIEARLLPGKLCWNAKNALHCTAWPLSS